MAENERICDYCEEEIKDMGMTTFPNGLAVCDICFENEVLQYEKSFNADSTPRFIPVEVMKYDEWWVRRFGRKYNPQDLGNAYNMSYVVLVRDIVIAEFDTQKEAENHANTVRTAISVLGGVTPSKIDHPLALKEMDGYKDKNIRGGMNMAETFNAENSDMDKKALVESEVSIKMNELFEFVNYHVDAEDGAGGDLYGGLDDIEEAVSDYFIGYWDFESRHISNNPRYQNAETFGAENEESCMICSKPPVLRTRWGHTVCGDDACRLSALSLIERESVPCYECGLSMQKGDSDRDGIGFYYYCPDSTCDSGEQFVENTDFGAETFNSYKVAPALSSYSKDELISSKAGPQGSASYDEMVYDPIAQDRLSAESFASDEYRRCEICESTHHESEFGNSDDEKQTMTPKGEVCDVCFGDILFDDFQNADDRDWAKQYLESKGFKPHTIEGSFEDRFVNAESFNAQNGGVSWELFDRKTKAREGNYKSYSDALEAWETKIIDEYPERVSENEWIVIDEVHHDEYGAETFASETSSTLKSMGYVAGTIGVGYLIFQRFVKDRLDETMNQ